MRARVVRSAGIVIALAALTWAEPAMAQVECAPPQMVGDSTSGPPGTVVVIHGTAMADDCPRPPGVATPSAGIDLYFRQGGTATLLTSVDADDSYEFTVELTVPADALPLVEGGFGTDRYLGAMLTYVDFAVTAAPAPVDPVDAPPTFTG